MKVTLAVSQASNAQEDHISDVLSFPLIPGTHCRCVCWNFLGAYGILAALLLWELLIRVSIVMVPVLPTTNYGSKTAPHRNSHICMKEYKWSKGKGNDDTVCNSIMKSSCECIRSLTNVHYQRTMLPSSHVVLEVHQDSFGPGV